MQYDLVILAHHSNKLSKLTIPAEKVREEKKAIMSNNINVLISHPFKDEKGFRLF